MAFSVSVRRCYCEEHCPDNQQNGTCIVQHGGMCFTLVEAVYDDKLGIDVAAYTYGCLPADERGFMQVSIVFWDNRFSLCLYILQIFQILQI